MKRTSQVFPLGIRSQLTLWYSLVFAVLMILATVLVYTRLQSLLAESLDAALKVQAQQIAGDIEFEKGYITIHDATSELPGFDPADKGLRVHAADVNLDSLVRVLTNDGKPFRTTLAF